MTQIDIEKLRSVLIDAHTLMRAHSASCRRNDQAETTCCTMAKARAGIIHAALTTLPALLFELERKTKALEAAQEALRPFAELVDDAKESASALQCDREDFFVTQIGGYRVGDLYLSDFVNAAAALKGEHHER